MAAACGDMARGGRHDLEVNLSAPEAARVTEQDRAEETLELSDSLQLLFEECRTVLPGIQALFGFQLIVVFNQGFSEKLVPWQRQIHLVAVVLVAFAIGLIMTPASLHRRMEQGKATTRLLLYRRSSPPPKE